MIVSDCEPFWWAGINQGFTSQVIGYSKMSIFSCINQNISTELTFVFLQYFSMTGYLRNTMCTWILFMGLILCQEEYYIRIMVTLIEAFIPLSLTKMVNASTLTTVPSISEMMQQNVDVYVTFQNHFQKELFTLQVHSLHEGNSLLTRTFKFLSCFLFSFHHLACWSVCHCLNHWLTSCRSIRDLSK